MTGDSGSDGSTEDWGGGGGAVSGSNGKQGSACEDEHANWSDLQVGEHTTIWRLQHN